MDRVLRALNAARTEGNRLTLYENYLLGLTPSDEKSAPILAGKQLDAVDKIGFVVEGIKPPEDSEMEVRYRVHELKSRDAKLSESVKDSEYVAHNKMLEAALPTERIRFYRVEITFQPRGDPQR